MKAPSDTNSSSEKDGERSKKIGRVAEKQFDLWCTAADLTSNKSTEDEEAWDFFVQAKTSVTAVRFLDHAPPAFSALVQSKGTAAASGAFRITLSNAIKLAKTSGPAFIFCAHVESNSVVNCWLVHCGREFIRRVLKTAAEQVEGAATNKTQLQFTPTDADRLDPEALGEYMARTIGDTRKYLEEKQSTLRTVGYDAPERFRMNVHRPVQTADEYYAELADFLVGLRDIEADVEVFDLRFGLERQKSSIEGAKLSRPLTPSEPDVEITVETPSGERVTLLCQSYLAAAYAPFLPAKHHRLRVVAPYIELLAWQDPARPGHVTLRWTSNDIGSDITAATLPARARASQALRLLHAEGARATLVRRGHVQQLPVMTDAPSGATNLRFLKALEDFEIVRRGFSLQLGDAPIEREFFIEAAPVLSVLASIAIDRVAVSEFRLERSAAHASGVRVGSQMAMVMPISMAFLDSTLTVVTAIVGTVRDDDERHVLVESRRLPRLLSSVSSPRLTAIDLKVMVEEAQALLRAQGIENVGALPLQEGERPDRPESV